MSPSTFIPSFPLLSFACNVVGYGNKMWHRRLCHPNSDSFVLCLILDYWEMKHVLLLIFLLIVHHANLAKVKFYLFLIMHLVPHNVLSLFIMMFGGLHLLFLMRITSTLLLSLMTLVALFGFTSFELNLKFF